MPVGVGIAGFRADLGIIDDPFGSWKDAESRRIRDRVWGLVLGRLLDPPQAGIEAGHHVHPLVRRRPCRPHHPPARRDPPPLPIDAIPRHLLAGVAASTPPPCHLPALALGRASRPSGHSGCRDGGKAPLS